MGDCMGMESQQHYSEIEWGYQQKMGVIMGSKHEK
jgi:hypothetical protein